MKVALLTAQSRISPVFETTCSSLMIDTANKCSIQRTFFFTSQNEIEMINELLNKKIQLIICGAIPCYLEKQLVDQGCNVLSFIAGEVDDVLQALHSNLLNDAKFKMPGCENKKCC